MIRAKWHGGVRLLVIAIVAWLALAAVWQSAWSAMPEEAAGDEAATAAEVNPEQEQVKLLQTGGRSIYVHRITLYDHEGRAINPKPREPEPYSTMQTCGKCHAVGEINHGWHFNAPDPDVAKGRPGEPWFVVDHLTGTQMPISSRGWPGVFTPQELGLTAWDFVNRFGHHMPGGGLGGVYHDADPALADEEARWEQSGQLEIDCMMCHAAENVHSQEEWAQQIDKQNFKWAATAAMGLAVITGTAKDIEEPDEFAMLDPAYEGPKSQLPMKYDPRWFDERGRALLNITRTPSSDRCYYCHTTAQVGDDAPPRWHVDGDVHLAAGLSCTDCHRNGIDHMIVRGYDGELAEGEGAVSTLSCRGCHYGDDGAEHAAWRQGGRLGAPRPLHRGLPPLHLERMTCTACHAGPWPEQATSALQTSLGHGLGLPSRERTTTDRPHIEGPVFVRQAHDGKIAPHRVAWAAYFGIRSKTEAGELTITPLPLEQVREAMAKTARGKRYTKGHAPGDLLSAEEIQAGIEALSVAATGAEDGKIVYVQHGRVATLEGGQLKWDTRELKPYAWAMGHDVRPASQSLGVGGCVECHGENAAIYFASVGMPSGMQVAIAQHQLLEEDEALLHRWAGAFAMRDAYKVAAGAGLLLMLALLLPAGLAGVRGVVAWAGRSQPGEGGAWTSAVGQDRNGGRTWLDRTAVVLLAVGMVGTGATSLLAIVRAGIGSLGGELLWWHMLLSPLVIAGLAGLILMRSHDSRFGGALTRFGGLRKALFWLLAIVGVASIAAILLSMTAVFAAETQHTLYTIHRWTGLTALLLLVIYLASSIRKTHAKR